MPPCLLCIIPYMHSKLSMYYVIRLYGRGEGEVPYPSVYLATWPLHGYPPVCQPRTPHLDACGVPSSCVYCTYTPAACQPRVPHLHPYMQRRQCPGLPGLL